MNKDPNQRLGCKNDAVEIKSHPWFKSIDWERVYKKEVIFNIYKVFVYL